MLCVFPPISDSIHTTDDAPIIGVPKKMRKCASRS